MLLKYCQQYTTILKNVKLFLSKFPVHYILVLMPIKIAIVEDDHAIAQMYKFKLESAGFSTCIAGDGQQGLKVIQENQPQLILLDLRMPVMSGDEMLEKMRQTKWGSDIRVIILTNISRSEAPHSLRLLSVDRYIVKAHHTPAQVLDIINEVLRLTTKNN